MTAKVSSRARAWHQAQLGRNSQSFRIVLPCSEVRWIETLTETLPDENGQPARILLASCDISRILSAEVDRKVTAERLDRIQSAAKIGAWEWDIRSGEASWLQSAWELLEPGGTGPVTLERWLAAVHPDDREHAQSNSLAGAEPGRVEHEYRIIRHEGTIRRLQSMGSVIRDESGKPLLACPSGVS
jgi:PAS domain-containing protein